MLKSPVLALGLLATLTFPALAADDEFKAPDSIVLKNGKVVSGLIVRNTALSVVMQEKDKENTYPKSDIVRIRDEANVGMAYTEIDRKGELPRGASSRTTCARTTTSSRWSRFPPRSSMRANSRMCPTSRSA